MKYILTVLTLLIFAIGISCSSGGSGVITGRVLDGFGNPLGGDGVYVVLQGNPVQNHPDQWGNFIINAPTGSYTLIISFSNPAAGFNYRVTDDVVIGSGSRNLGSYTLLNVQNMDAWEAYNAKDWQGAISKFNEQASLARGGQVFLPYMRIIEGDVNENTLLTQGILSAENGLGWTYARGLGNFDEARSHFELSMSSGYNNYDAKVGLAGIALTDGDAETAVKYIQEVLDIPGIYDSSQTHDQIHDIDLMAARSLAEFLLGYDADSRSTAQTIADKLPELGNPGSATLIEVLENFR
ncbi:MAG TPA: hypothetical protein VGB30_13030 [bacterium]